jgi:hypothetical protein
LVVSGSGLKILNLSELSAAAAVAKPHGLNLYL